ncbi:hypothetical protein QFC20_004480 [Naganishia adeliensis]|uniref:Uncharacterized protein n=1 Tax=Naganishia adeliensis TaxID=92952 RepID=A0ACC2VZ82_9TREE|nr:hypothetical protein QFC20_004480 [Naganishia adeliensis]
MKYQHSRPPHERELCAISGSHREESKQNLSGESFLLEASDSDMDEHAQPAVRRGSTAARYNHHAYDSGFTACTYQHASPDFARSAYNAVKANDEGHTHLSPDGTLESTYSEDSETFHQAKQYGRAVKDLAGKTSPISPPSSKPSLRYVDTWPASGREYHQALQDIASSTKSTVGHGIIVETTISRESDALSSLPEGEKGSFLRTECWGAEPPVVHGVLWTFSEC